MSHVLYFAYGANMSASKLARHGIRVASAEPARLDGYRLAFDLPGIPLIEPAFASIVRAPGETVHGVLYRMSERDADRLDRFESPRYRRAPVEVTGTLSGRAPAFAYENRMPVAGLVPSRRYLRLLCEGARDSGLPGEWIDFLRAHESAYVPLLSEVTELLWKQFVGAPRRR
jgi:sulfite reductase (NADPH) flavoprotein alpha-component